MIYLYTKNRNIHCACCKLWLQHWGFDRKLTCHHRPLGTSQPRESSTCRYILARPLFSPINSFALLLYLRQLSAILHLKFVVTRWSIILGSHRIKTRQWRFGYEYVLISSAGSKEVLLLIKKKYTTTKSEEKKNLGSSSAYVQQFVVLPGAVLINRSIVHRRPQVCLTCLAFISWFSGWVRTKHKTLTGFSSSAPSMPSVNLKMYVQERRSIYSRFVIQKKNSTFAALKLSSTRNSLGGVRIAQLVLLYNSQTAYKSY